jgi:hypothetical protein
VPSQSEDVRRAGQTTGKEAGRDKFLLPSCSLPGKIDDRRNARHDYRQTSLLDDPFTSFLMAIDTTNILVSPYEGYKDATVAHVTVPEGKNVSVN